MCLINFWTTQVSHVVKRGMFYIHERFENKFLAFDIRTSINHMQLIFCSLAKFYLVREYINYELLGSISIYRIYLILFYLKKIFLNI